MTIATIIEREGGVASFSRATGIPLRTCESWNQTAKSGRKPPTWLVPILDEWLKMKRRKKK